MAKEAHSVLQSLKMEKGAKEGSCHENISLPKFFRARAPQTPSETLQTSGILGSEGVNICCLKPTNFWPFFKVDIGNKHSHVSLKVAWVTSSLPPHVKSQHLPLSLPLLTFFLAFFSHTDFCLISVLLSEAISASLVNCRTYDSVTSWTNGYLNLASLKKEVFPIWTQELVSFGYPEMNGYAGKRKKQAFRVWLVGFG